MNDLLDLTVKILIVGRADLNLMSLDPLKVNEMNIVQGDDSPIAITLNFRNLDVHGISDTVITKAM